MTASPRAPESSAYGRDPRPLDDLGMLWFDGQCESQSVCVAGANERAAQLFGAGSAADLRGLPLQGLFAPSSWSELEGALARGTESESRTLELELRGAGGQSVRARARLLDCAPALLLLEEQDAAPASALVCARMADGLLHDLRSPLMAVSGFAEVLGLRHAAELGDDARRCVENIAAAARRLEQQTELLASYSRLGAGDLRLRPLDLRILLQRLGAEDGDAPVELQLEPGLPLVAGDAGVLRVALTALLQGALLLRARRERERLRIEIACAAGDEPAGNPSDLALARRALELHGGSLESELRGTQRLLVLELPALAGS